MKIALLGSAPSSVRLAPFGKPDWQIWACSPGTYALLPRCEAFFELHRWEPGVIGKPDTQRPWFSPEYVAWMGKQSRVWMYEPVPEIPASRAIPFEALCRRWGSYFWTSSLAYMLAMAMDDILEARAKRQPALEGVRGEDDMIGLWGVDMSATEEYGYQRAGCQHFLCMANMLGIGIVVPPESDLLRPMPPYGLVESTHFLIKSTVRKNELELRLQNARTQITNATHEEHFLKGCIDDLKYQMDTWGDDRQGIAPSPELAGFMVRYGSVPAAPSEPVIQAPAPKAAAPAKRVRKKKRR